MQLVVCAAHNMLGSDKLQQFRFCAVAVSATENCLPTETQTELQPSRGANRCPDYPMLFGLFRSRPAIIHTFSIRSS